MITINHQNGGGWLPSVNRTQRPGRPRRASQRGGEGTECGHRAARIAGGVMTEVIVDPELPEQVRRELEWTPVDALRG
jgi:hypothetical protein